VRAEHLAGPPVESVLVLAVNADSIRPDHRGTSPALGSVGGLRAAADRPTWPGSSDITGVLGDPGQVRTVLDSAINRLIH
jgi:hypothetical protein